jgi:hypothetical protein
MPEELAVSSNRNTVIRSLHDVGAAAWFGGSLMGAVGLNGASQEVSDPTERTGVAASGWARWSPVAAIAIGAHLVGGAGLVLAHRGRIRSQSGVTANTAVKAALTAAALGTTVYSGVLGAKLATAESAAAEGGTIPGYDTPDDIARAQQQLRVLQWVTPVLTGALVILGAQQGEQQRPAERLRGLGRKAARKAAQRGHDLQDAAADRGRSLQDLAVQRGRDLGDLAVQRGRELGDVAVQRGRDLGDLAVQRGHDLQDLAAQGGRSVQDLLPV